MTARDWIVKVLGGSGPANEPTGAVEVAIVEFWQSELVVSGLAAAGIKAVAVPESQAARPIGPRLQSMARIMVAGADRIEARQIVDELTRPGYGPTDDA